MLELSSGKVLDLTRFIALLPDSTAKESKYELILEGYPHPINLEPEEAVTIKQHLQAKTTSVQENGGWDREEQLRKNQPKMKLLKEWIEKTKKEQPTPEKEAAFEEFKQIIDAERPEGQKLYQD
jgi:hypothetical protein